MKTVTTPKTAFFRFRISAPTGVFSVIVHSDKFGAKSDARTAFAAFANCNPGQFSVGDAEPVTTADVAGYDTIKGCNIAGKPWAWLRKK